MPKPDSKSRDMRLIVLLEIGAIIFNVAISQGSIRHCAVSGWGMWLECNAKCNEGFAVRKRTVIQQPSKNIFSKPCPALSENKRCGTPNNGCQHFCEKTTGSCYCKGGFNLGNDQKTCADKNECYENDGLGPCDQNCTNLKPGYQCSCFRGFLLKDKHHCIDNSAESCSKFQIRSKENGECICKNGLEGPKCDRNLTRCNRKICSFEKVCATTLNFLNWNKCYGKFYLVPVLLHLPFKTYSAKNFHYKVEEYVTEVLEGSSGRKSLYNLNYDRKRKRRSNAFDVVYVESFDPIKVKAAYTFVTFLVFDVKKSFKPYSKQEICNKLVDSDIACISKVDCYILRSVGIKCPDVFELNTNQGKTMQNETKAGHKIKPWIFILIFALLFLVVIALFLFFYKKRKRSYGKSENSVEYSDQSNAEPLIMGSGSQPNANGINTQRVIASQNNFDEKVFSSNCNDKTREPLYESIPNIMDENNYVDMNMESSKYDMPKNNTGKKVNDLCVDISEKESRYTTPPARNISKDKEKISVNNEGIA